MKSGFLRASCACIATALLVSLLAGCGNPAGTSTTSDSSTTSSSSSGVSGSISSSVTWSANTSVTASVSVASGATLTISPGVTVSFAEGASLNMESGSTLSAVGTADKTIVFQSASSAKRWEGINFGSGAIANTLKYASVSGAGYNSSYAIDFASGAKADIENCTISGNASGGIDASYAASGTVIKSNRFYSNGKYGLYASDGVAFDKTNAFAASGATVDLSDQYNAVGFYGDVSSTKTFDITEVPYLFYASPTISGSLTVAPGVSLSFESGATLNVASGATLSAVGSADSTIAFKPKTTSAQWSGIDLAGGAIATTLKYVSLTGAGANSSYAIDFASGAKADIENCTISGNASGGIDASYAAPGTVIKSNRFYSNGKYGLYASDGVAFDKTNAFSASGATVDLSDQYNAVGFYGDVSSTRIFDITEVPYLFYASPTVTSSGKLTINSGVSLSFESGAHFSVAAGATLSAVGASASLVSFKPKNSSTQWKGIDLATGSTATTLSYVSVSGAGSDSSYAIDFASDAVADIQNCTISGNAAGGVDATYAGAGTVVSNNDFGNNGDDGTNVYDLVQGTAGSYSNNVLVANTNAFTSK